jgi:hypothetical protein
MKREKTFEWTRTISIKELKDMGFTCESQETTNSSQFFFVNGQKFNCSKTAAKLLAKHKDYEQLVLDILKDKETGIPVLDPTGKPVVILQKHIPLKQGLRRL